MANWEGDYPFPAHSLVPVVKQLLDHIEKLNSQSTLFIKYFLENILI